MIIGYGNYSFVVSVGGNGSPLPVALTPTANMYDARTGSVTQIRWSGGTQTTGNNVALSITSITSAYANPAYIGVVHLANVVGLPEGTLVELSVGAVTTTTRLRYNRRNELHAVFYLPLNTTATFATLRIYNNVNGSPSIAALTVFAVGEIYVGGVCFWPSLIDDSPPKEFIVDTTQWQRRSEGGQLWPLMRKPISQVSAKLGRFGIANAFGGRIYSNVRSGLNNQFTDMRTVAYALSTSSVCHINTIPHKGFNNRPATLSPAGFYYDQDMTNMNAMLARPIALREIDMDKPPYLSWGADFLEAA